MMVITILPVFCLLESTVVAQSLQCCSVATSLIQSITGHTGFDLFAFDLTDYQAVIADREKFANWPLAPRPDQSALFAQTGRLEKMRPVLKAQQQLTKNS
jgi:hypothetical protein